MQAVVVGGGVDIVLLTVVAVVVFGVVFIGFLS